MRKVTLNNLLNAYGEDLLKYIFSIDENEKLPESEDLLDKETFDILAKHTIQNGWIMELSVLFRTLPGSLSLPVLLHMKNSKKDLQPFECEDKLLNSLYKLLSEIWPIFLCDFSSHKNEYLPKNFSIISVLTSALYGNPLLNEFCKLFLEDNSLKNMFPGTDLKKISESDYGMVSSNWMTNLGSGGTQQMFAVVSSLLFEIASRCMMKEDSVTYELLCKYLPDVVCDWKKLAEGKTIKSICLYGFEGISVEGDINIKCGDGILRNPLKYELNTLLTYDTPPQVVFEKEIEIKIDIISNDIAQEKINEWFSNNIDDFNKLQMDIQKELDRVKLSILLSSNLESKELLLANENSCFIESPIQNGSQLFGIYKFYKPIGGLLTETTIKDIRFWYDHIVVDKLSIAIKRLLSSAVNRPDPTDSFIDAIIVWENIFGTSVETTFRVTASIAKLLEEDLEKRKILRKELKKLYDSRSKLVHGTSELSFEEAQKCKERAINIAIKTLKRLYRDRSDLIPYNSDLRSEIILLETD